MWSVDLGLFTPFRMSFFRQKGWDAGTPFLLKGAAASREPG
jgi:hypothetical protein